MNNFIAIVSILVLIALCIMPIWFVCWAVMLFISPGGWKHFKAHRVRNSLWAAASFLVVYTFVCSMPSGRGYFANALDPIVNAPVTAESLEESDAIVEGSFDLDQVVSSSTQAMSGPYGPGIEVKCYVIPFHVERSAKGNPASVIYIRIFFPVERASIVHWGLPLKEKLLLLLKKDAKRPETFTLLRQQTSWLVIEKAHEAAVAPAEAGRFVLEDAERFLSACVDHPGLSGAIEYFTVVHPYFAMLGMPVNSGITFPQTDPARSHALAIGKNLANGDAAFLAVAQKFENEYGQTGELARSVRVASGDYSELEARLKTYNAEKIPAPVAPGQFAIIGGDNHFNFPWELANAIKDSADLGKMMPVITEALASPDPRMRKMVAQALRERQYQDNGNFEHGNRLGNAFYPVMVRLLDDPDREVQYTAMGCIFEMSGCIKQRFGHRDLELWATDIVRRNPDFYIAQYKAWWEKNKERLTP